MNSVQLLGSICIVYSKSILSHKAKQGYAIAYKLPRSSSPPKLTSLRKHYLGTNSKPKV